MGKIICFMCKQECGLLKRKLEDFERHKIPPIPGMSTIDRICLKCWFELKNSKNEKVSDKISKEQIKKNIPKNVKIVRINDNAYNFEFTDKIVEDIHTLQNLYNYAYKDPNNWKKITKDIEKIVLKICSFATPRVKNDDMDKFVQEVIKLVNKSQGKNEFTGGYFDLVENEFLNDSERPSIRIRKTKETIRNQEIEDIENSIQENVIKTQSFVTQLGNMALYYARLGEKEITMAIIDELNRSKAFANAKNVIQTVHTIDKELDRIEEETKDMDWDTPNDSTIENSNALEILKVRYAKGEISREEFEQMKKDID